MPKRDLGNNVGHLGTALARTPFPGDVPGANAWLVLSRALPYRDASSRKEGSLAADKHDWAVGHGGDARLRAALLERRREAVGQLGRQGKDVKEVVLEVRAPVAVGHSGAGSANDASITLSRVSGDPLLPGTALKGICRASLPQRDDLFGTAGDERGEGTGRAGTVTFLPGVAARRPVLGVAVLTPHAGPYYEGQGAEPPDERNQPRPVEFLVVREGTFVAHVVSEKPGQAEEVAEALGRAAGDLGIGAKTASGFGFFEAGVK
jgi:CRISPR-associated protein Cmr6